MSRMNFLDNGVWLSLPAGRPSDSSGKAGDAGYPPYSIEVLPADGEACAMRVTLAVAGFRTDDLDVRVEKGALTISGKRGDERRAAICIAASPRFQAELRARPGRRGAQGRAA
jgi:HSP20 family molecular chaperone IbpA